MTEAPSREGIQTFEEVREFEAVAATHEDLVCVEQAFPITYNRLVEPRFHPAPSTPSPPHTLEH